MTNLVYDLREVDDLIHGCQSTSPRVDPGHGPAAGGDLPPGLWLVAVDDGVGGELHLRANTTTQWAHGAVWPLRRRAAGHAGWQASPTTWDQLHGQNRPSTFGWRFFPLRTPDYDLPQLVHAGLRAGCTVLVIHYAQDNFTLGVGRRRCRRSRG